MTVCDCLSKNVHSLRNYKYLKYQFEIFNSIYLEKARLYNLLAELPTILYNFYTCITSDYIEVEVRGGGKP